MEHILEAQKRDTAHKSETKRLRRTGEIPAIVYGNHKTPVPVSINSRAFRKQFSHISESALITLKISGEDDKSVLIKQFEYDTARGELVHIDFYEIEKGKLLHANVEIVLVGNAEGVHMGGILEHFLHEVEVECLPKDLPPTIEINIENLNIGDVIHVSDLPTIEGVKYTQNPEQVVLHIVAPKRVEETVAETEEGEEDTEEAAEGSE